MVAENQEEIQTIAVIRDEGGSELGRLTTEHSASSYGQPILLYQGEPFGPGDWLQQPGGIGPLSCRAWIDSWASRPGRTKEEKELANKFLGGGL